MQWRTPPCSACAPNRRQLVPEYRSCKDRRLCDLVESGLLARCYLETLDEYEAAQRQLLRGANDLQRTLADPFPCRDDFIQEVKRSHRLLFQYVLPGEAGRFRDKPQGELDEVVFGGSGRNRREGSQFDRIELDLQVAHVHAMAVPNIGLVGAAARLLAQVLRVHPFHDGNGRIARALVTRLLASHKFYVPAWNTSGAGRRSYIKALEYAHSRVDTNAPRPYQWLEKWLRPQVFSVPDDGDA